MISRKICQSSAVVRQEHEARSPSPFSSPAGKGHRSPDVSFQESLLFTRVRKGAAVELPLSQPDFIDGAFLERRSKTLWPLCLLTLAILLTGCRAERPAAVSFPKAPVILISIDTLRSDHLPVYGYRGVATPNIDRLRRDSVLFEKAYSHCPMTLPAHISMLTGLLPSEHEVRNNVGYRFDASRFPNLPQLLESHGYETAAAVSSYVLRADTGMSAMFSRYDDDIPVGTEGASSSYQRSGSAAVRFARDWIGQRRTSPFFFLLHLYEPHAPYDPPEPFRSRYKNAYDGEVAASDALVGELLDELTRIGLYEKAIIILTSDHGEGLMDHGEDQHGILLYREAIQVPLIVKLPANAHKGESVFTEAQHVDIPPTVLDLLGLEGTRSWRGLSLMKVLSNRTRGRSIYSETYYPRIHLGWSELRSLVSDGKHYVSSPRPELYDLTKDPGEKRDLIAGDRRTAARLKAELQSIPAGSKRLGHIDPEEVKKLAALGYIGNPQEREGGVLPNPRDEIRSLAEIKKAFKAADERRFELAVALLRGLLEKNPNMTDISEKLGEALVASGRYEEAIVVFRDAIARSERFSGDMALSLANAYMQANRLEEARRAADLGLKSHPMRAHELLAKIALRQKDFPEAEKEAESAINRNGNQPSVMLLRADIRRAQGDFAGALEALEETEKRALSMRVVRLARLNYLRGDLLARLGREQEAEMAYKKAIEEFPGDVQSYANLSVIYFVQGKRRATIEILKAMVDANPNERAVELAAQTLESFELAEEAKSLRRRKRAA